MHVRWAIAAPVAVSLNQWLLRLIFDLAQRVRELRVAWTPEFQTQVLSAGKEWSERVSALAIRPWSSTEWILIVKKNYVEGFAVVYYFCFL